MSVKTRVRGTSKTVMVCTALGLLVDSEIVLSTRYGKTMVFINKPLSTETFIVYNNNSPNSISFMLDISSKSGSLHSELVCRLFLQVHRETDRFFAASGVQLAQSTRGFFHYLRSAFSSMLKSRVGNILVKTATFLVTLNLDGAPITSKSHTHITYSQSSRLLTSSLSLGVPVPRATVYARRVNSLVLVCSLSSHRHSYIGLIFSSRFIDS